MWRDVCPSVRRLSITLVYSDKTEQTVMKQPQIFFHIEPEIDVFRGTFIEVVKMEAAVE